MTDDLVAFLRARFDEDETPAKETLCINCKILIVPLRNAFGITGYTHDSWDGGEHGWQGQRCPGALTGAEAVQNPARVLAEVAAKRRILDEHCAIMGPGWCSTCDVPGDVKGNVHGCQTLRLLALPYAAHPDYRPEWLPGA